MTDDEEATPRTTTHIGRHGSPNVTIAFPFSHVTTTDGPLRDAVIELAALISRLAAAAGDDQAAELTAVRAAAEELAAQLQAG